MFKINDEFTYENKKKEVTIGMNRLEVIRKIEELQINKNRHENVLTDIKSSYFEGGRITFDLVSKDFNPQYSGNPLYFDKERMKKFIETEIMLIDNDIYLLVRKLHDDY